MVSTTESEWTEIGSSEYWTDFESDHEARIVKERKPKRFKYDGSSERTKRRKAAAIRHRKQFSHSILEFFSPVEKMTELDSVTTDEASVLPGSDNSSASEFAPGQWSGEEPFEFFYSEQDGDHELERPDSCRVISEVDIRVVNEKIKECKNLAKHGEYIEMLTAIRHYWSSIVFKKFSRNRAGLDAAKHILCNGKRLSMCSNLLRN